MCRELIGSMGPMEEEYEGKGVAFLLVNCQQPEADGRAYISTVEGKRHWAFADDAAMKALGIRTAPAQVLVDREGRVAWTSSFGSLSEGVPAMRRALDGVLAAK